MSLINELAYICKELRMLGAHDLTREAIIAFAAVTDTKDPRPDLSYSYVMRILRKGDDKRRLKFQKKFKEVFDECIMNDIEDPHDIALMKAIKEIDFHTSEEKTQEEKDA